VRLAHEIGFHVEVWDHRKARLLSPALALADVRRHVRVSALEAAAAALSCRVGAVVMNHHLAADRAALAGLFRASPAYLGVLGPRARTTRLVDDVARTLGKAPPPFASPVGLDLGGDGAHAIALSIVAEAHAVLHGREGGRLRARRGAIHADAA
jgi:xanthine/CO dehydrogenase XdhC/CoxF family maturation factor